MSATPGYSNGGPTMGQVGLVAAGASAASGIIGALGQDRPDKPAPMRDYGYGRGQYGFFGGPDPTQEEPIGSVAAEVVLLFL